MKISVLFTDGVHAYAHMYIEVQFVDIKLIEQ